MAYESSPSNLYIKILYVLTKGIGPMKVSLAPSSNDSGIKMAMDIYEYAKN